MLYGDLVTLMPAGLQIGAKALSPLGISTGSVCWGVWVRDAKATPDQEPDPHLVITPVHPDFWPYLLRVELKLSDHPEAMVRAAKVIADCDMNIQFGEFSPSGHHHSTWNLVCEAVAVRRAYAKEIESFRLSGDRKLLNNLATKLATSMYEAGINLREKMREADAPEENRFFHPRILAADPHFVESPTSSEPFLLHNPYEIAPGKVREEALRDFQTAVQFRWIQNLPVFKFYGMNAKVPDEFRLQSDGSILRPADGRSFEDIAGLHKIDLPTKALASFHPSEHYVRVIPIRDKKQLARLLEIEVQYDAQFTSHSEEDGELPPDYQDTTKGTWARVGAELADANVAVKRVTNMTIRREPRGEKGTLTMIGVKSNGIDEADLISLQLDLARLSENSDPAHNGGGKPPANGRKLAIAAEPRRSAFKRVFISWRIDSHKPNLLLDIAEDRARYWGLEPVVVRNPVGQQLTPRVTDAIRECAALFQILTVSKDEWRAFINSEASLIRPELHWMWYEYGVAAGQNLRVARIIDISVMSFERWRQRLRVGADEVLASFDLREEEKKLKEDFDAAMRRLAERVHGAGTEH